MADQERSKPQVVSETKPLAAIPLSVPSPRPHPFSSSIPVLVHPPAGSKVKVLVGTHVGYAGEVVSGPSERRLYRVRVVTVGGRVTEHVYLFRHEFEVTEVTNA